MTPPRVTVVTSCTGLKVPLASGVAIKAERLYRGQQHLRLMRGVDHLRSRGGRADVWIVSAGHGLIAGASALPPYERTFQGMPTLQRRALADELGVPAAVGEALAASADLAIVLLGDDYLDACRLDDKSVVGAPTLVFASASSALRLPSAPGLRLVPLRVEHTRVFGAGYVALKGEIGGRLLHALGDGLAVDELLAGDPLSVLAERSVSAKTPATAGSLF